MSLKSTFVKVSAVLALVLSMNVVTAPKAHAYLIIEGASGMTPSDGPWDQGFLVSASYTALCIITLPFCLLEEKGSSEASISSDHLAANGYSAQEIAQISKDQKAVAKNLKARHMVLKIGAQDNRASVASDLQSVYPSVSAAYVDFISDSAALK